jgi:hypothetical protein
MRVSHETIYLSLFVQSRGALRRELQRCLRTGRAMRDPQRKRLPQGRGQLRDTLHISQRPQRRPTEQCLGIGKATWCSAGDPARSGLWWSATAAIWCCSDCLTGSPPSACVQH